MAGPGLDQLCEPLFFLLISSNEGGWSRILHFVACVWQLGLTSLHLASLALGIFSLAADGFYDLLARRIIIIRLR